MPLNDLVKDYSLTTISQKTNIPIEVLEKLLNKEWESLQATKAKGFIAIIEREFDVDLSELKEEAAQYYNTHKKDEPKRPIDLVDAQIVSNGNKIVTNIVAIIAFILVVYAVWFYFFKPKDGNIIPQEINSSGLIKESIDSAKRLVGLNDEPKKEEIKKKSLVEANSSINRDKDKKVQGIREEKKEKIEKFDITVDVKKNKEADKNDSLNLAISTKNSEINNTQKSRENSDIDAQEIEKNRSINLAVESLLEENHTLKENKEENNKSNTSFTLEENIEKNSTKEKKLISEANSSKESNTTLSLKEIDTITLKPTVRVMWAGIYNLKTKKRVAKLIHGEFKFNRDGGDVAIVTGHSKFEIATDNGKTKRFNNKGRKYLLVSKEGIKELTKSEYRTLTKRRAW